MLCGLEKKVWSHFKVALVIWGCWVKICYSELEKKNLPPKKTDFNLWNERQPSVQQLVTEIWTVSHCVYSCCSASAPTPNLTFEKQFILLCNCLLFRGLPKISNVKNSLFYGKIFVSAKKYQILSQWRPLTSATLKFAQPFFFEATSNQSNNCDNQNEV